MTSAPVLSLTSSGDGSRPLLVLGPSLGTSAVTLWGACMPLLAESFDVVAWDLPGHGLSTSATRDFSMADLADAVVAAVAPVLEFRGDLLGRFHYAGDSIGGAVGLQLLLDHPDRIQTATLLCTGARIGTRESWRERADLVRREGTRAVVPGSRRRWFGPGFVERKPSVAQALLAALEDADPVDYARACAVLAGFDVRDRLDEIQVPVQAVAGAADQATPVFCLGEIAGQVAGSRLVVLDGVGHLAPAEDPHEVARVITDWSGLAASSRDR